MFKLKKNVGEKDRRIRFALAIVLILAGLFLQGGPLGGALILIAAILMISSAVHFCPGYALLGKTTCCGGGCHGDKDAVDKPKTDAE